MCKSRWPWKTLNCLNAYTITGNQQVIRLGRNVRLMLVLLTYLFRKFSSKEVCQVGIFERVGYSEGKSIR